MSDMEKIFEEQGEVSFIYGSTMYTIVKKNGEAYVSSIFYDGEKRILKMVTELEDLVIHGKSIREIASIVKII